MERLDILKDNRKILIGEALDKALVIKLNNDKQAKEELVNKVAVDRAISSYSEGRRIPIRPASERKPSIERRPNIEPYSEGRKPLTSFVIPSRKPSQAGPVEPPSRKPSQAGPEETPSENVPAKLPEIIKRNDDESYNDYTRRITGLVNNNPSLGYNMLSGQDEKNAVDLIVSLNLIKDAGDSNGLSPPVIGGQMFEVARLYKNIYNKFAMPNPHIKINRKSNVLNEDGSYSMSYNNLIKDLTLGFYRHKMYKIRDENEPYYEPVPDYVLEKNINNLIKSEYPKSINDKRLKKILSNVRNVKDFEMGYEEPFSYNITPTSSTSSTSSPKKPEVFSEGSISEELKKEFLSSSSRKSSRKPSQAGEAKEEEEKYAKPKAPKPEIPKPEIPKPEAPKPEVAAALVEPEYKLPSTELEKTLKAFAENALDLNVDKTENGGAYQRRIDDVAQYKKDGIVLRPYNMDFVNNIINNPKYNTEERLKEIFRIKQSMNNMISEQKKMNSQKATFLLSRNGSPGQTPEEKLATEYKYIIRFNAALKANGIQGGKGRKSRKSTKEKAPKLSMTKKEYDISTQKFMKQGREGKVSLPKELTQPSSIARGATKFSNDELNRIIAAILSDRS